MNNPYTISVQYNAAKCGWTVICHDDADNFVGVRYYPTMDPAVSFAHQQCYKIMDLGNDIALTVFRRDGDRAYSVSPQQFNRAYERDVMQQIERDFRHGVVVEFTGEAA